MNSFTTMFKKELLEIYRSKKFLILVIIFAFIAISSPILAKLIPNLLKSMPATPGLTITLPDPTWKDAIDQLVKNLIQFGYIVIIFMFAGSIAEEKNKKTLEIVLTKPVSRASLVLAKFCASGLYLKLVFIASAIVFYFYTFQLFGSFSIVNYLWLCLFLLIFLFLILAVTIFFSAMANTQITAVGLAFLTTIVFTTVIGYIKKLTDYSPSFVVSNYKELMESGKVADFLPSALTSLGLIVLLTIGAIYVFKRQEIER